jgi:rhomboid family GlyGly-CTERM serine protease
VKRTFAPPSRRSAALVTALASLPALAIHAWPALIQHLQFDRARVAAGELWRVVSGHWTHFSLDHLLWDLAAFALLFFLSWRESPPRTVATLASSAILIPAAVWVALPEITTYRGLSGLDSALFAFLAITLARRERKRGNRLLSSLFVLTLVGFVAKILFEMWTGSTVFVDATEFIPVPLAHAVGAVCGVAATGGTHVLDSSRHYLRHFLGSLLHRRSGLPKADRLDPAADHQ